MKNKKLTKVMAIMAAVVFTLSGTVTAFAVESPGNGDAVVEEGTSSGSSSSTSSGGSCSSGWTTPTDCVVDVAKAPVANGTMASKLVTNVVAGERYNLGYVAAGSAVSQSVFDKAKETGAKITVSSDAGTHITWQFGTIQYTTDFNPTVYVTAKNDVVSAALANISLAPGTRYKTVSFAYDGILPGTAEVTINFNQDALFVAGDTLYLYYCNPVTNTFEFVDSAPYENNAGKFTMTHCSDYIVTTQPIPTVEVSTSPKTGDGINYGLYVVILVSALGLAVVSMKKKNA